MAAYAELPTFSRRVAGNAPPSCPRCCLTSPLFLFCLLPATIMLGVFLLMGAPSLSRQPSAPAAPPLLSSSFGGVQAAARVAAAAVLPQARPLRADKQSRGVALPAKRNSTAAAAKASATELAHKLQEISKSSASKPDATATDVIELSSGTDARRLTSGAQHFSDLSADNSSTSTITTTERNNSTSSAAASSNGTAASGSGSGSIMSVQDADIAAILAAAAQGEPPLDLAACLQENDTDRPFTVQEFLNAQPARLKVEAVMSSRLPRPATAVTMLVTATLSRKEMIAGLCESYGSVISLVVYVGVLAGDVSAQNVIVYSVSAVQAEFDRLEAAGACQLDVLVVSERLQDEAGLRLFPINVARNLALLNAKTELVMLGDLDLLAGSDLKEAVNDTAQYKELLESTQGNRLVVIPAFEADSAATALKAAAGGKTVARRMWREAKDFRFFLEDGYEPAHNDTRFDLWADATRIYALNETTTSFEPWWIGRRSDVSVYDARYRGYGKNKVQHLQMLKLILGFQYVVHPRAYLVHRPHPPSAAKKQFNAEIDALEPAESPADAVSAAEAVQHLNIFGATERWFSQQCGAGAGFRPLVTPGFSACRDALPHWNMFGQNGEPLRTVTQVIGARAAAHQQGAEA